MLDMRPRGAEHRVHADAVPMTDADVRRVTELLKTHHEVTGSTRAAELLGFTRRARQSLHQVEPRDFARVMRAQAEAKANGLPQTEVTEIMMEAARG